MLAWVPALELGQERGREQAWAQAPAQTQELVPILVLPAPAPAPALEQAQAQAQAYSGLMLLASAVLRRSAPVPRHGQGLEPEPKLGARVWVLAPVSVPEHGQKVESETKQEPLVPVPVLEPVSLLGVAQPRPSAPFASFSMPFQP